MEEKEKNLPRLVLIKQESESDFEEIGTSSSSEEETKDIGDA